MIVKSHSMSHPRPTRRPPESDRKVKTRQFILDKKNFARDQTLVADEIWLSYVVLPVSGVSRMGV